MNLLCFFGFHSWTKQEIFHEETPYGVLLLDGAKCCRCGEIHSDDAYQAHQLKMLYQAQRQHKVMKGIL
jgi:hypothetical protein